MLALGKATTAPTARQTDVSHLPFFPLDPSPRMGQSLETNGSRSVGSEPGTPSLLSRVESWLSREKLPI